jgi:glycosyltransferase involved in cell wall biosynthesis
MQNLLAYPPTGYKFVSQISSNQAFSVFAAKYNFSYKFYSQFANYIPMQFLSSEMGRFRKIPRKAVLTYSLHHLIFRNEPWLLDVTTELPFILGSTEQSFSRNKSRIKRLLNSDSCKRILCQVEKGREAFVATLGDGIGKKIEVIPWSVPSKKIKKIPHNGIRLLFVNSGNINTAEHFFGKGGAEVVESFKKLSKLYANIELVIRSGMPEELKAKYLAMGNIKIIDRPIAWSKLEKIWASSDIFIHPNHYNTSAQVFLDAMSYGLPIVTTDTWANSEFISEGKTGFLVHNPKSAKFTEGPILHLTSGYLKEIIRCPSDEVIEGIVNKLSTLIDNSNLRQKMGKTAKLEIDEGRFSQYEVTKQLKRVLDEVTKK